MSADTRRLLSRLKLLVVLVLKRLYRLLLALLAVLGLKRFFRLLDKDAHPYHEGWSYADCRRLFDVESGFHKRILAEPDYDKRMMLYTQANEAIFQVYQDCSPRKLDFGFNPYLINNFSELFENGIVIDYGCGYGSSTQLLGRKARYVYGIDVSRLCIETARNQFNLENVEFILSTDLTIPFEDESVDAVYSNDLLEHLHPEDAKVHLREVCRVLRKGGSYLFWTPGSRSGPHDCTNLFYPRGIGFKARGAHFKEYTFDEVENLLRETGYEKIKFPDPIREVLALATK